MGDLQNSVGLSSYKLAQFVFEHIEQNRPDLKGVVSNIQGIEEAITSVAEPDERCPDGAVFQNKLCSNLLEY